MIGLNDTIQVTSDGRIHSDRRGIGTRIRQLDRGEEARLQSLLGRFAVLDSFQDDRAFDGFMTKVWARGHGLGQGSETDAQELGDFLRRCIGFDVYQPPPIPPSFPEIPNVPPDPNWPMDPEGP